MLRGLGYELPDPSDSRQYQADGAGNSAWQRAQAIAMRADATQRRN